jgi:hypothetical protein
MVFSPDRCILPNSQGAEVPLRAPDGIVILQTTVRLDSVLHNPKMCRSRGYVLLVARCRCRWRWRGLALRSSPAGLPRVALRPGLPLTAGYPSLPLIALLPRLSLVASLPGLSLRSGLALRCWRVYSATANKQQERECD